MHYRIEMPPHEGAAQILRCTLASISQDKAMQALEQGYTERQLHMTEIGIEPAFDTLRPDPRFQDLVRRIGVQR